jgi:multiple sugar transport system ATP-binding protein
MASVTVSHITKRFGTSVAVNSLSLDIRDGEFMVMLGPSGCGKTTALRCVAGLEHQDEGDIIIGGERVNDRGPKDRDIAMVFQSYALYPHMKVYDNIAYPLRIKQMTRQQLDARVRKVADLLQIEPLLQRLPSQLSGGEQQRVALGRAIVREPKVFLMDEPLSNLDAKLRLYMRAEIKALQKQLNTTTIYVTHDQAEAMTMADRIAVMEKGVLQQADTPDTIYSFPANAFVAGFVGSPPMNFLDCTYEDGTLIAGPINLSADPWASSLGSGSREVRLGIRPEDITVSLKPTDGATPVPVYVSEPLGSEVIVNVRVGETIMKAHAAPDVKPGPGSTVWIRVALAQVHLFSKENGQRIARRTLTGNDRPRPSTD